MVQYGLMRMNDTAGGFTVVELLVSIVIFVTMTALLVAKYGNFNQSVLLTDLAYDTALTIRTAQAYGVSVKSANDAVSAPITDPFQSAYGVHFDTDPTGGKNSQIILFADINQNGAYDPTASPPETVSVYNIKRGAVVGQVCLSLSGTGSCTVVNGATLDVTYKRPDPSARICSTLNGIQDCLPTYAEIVLQSSDGNTRKVAVLKNGQISVRDN